MMKMMIMSSSNLMNINFMKMNHPMLIMLTIIIQTMFVSVMTGMLMESFWLSYILMLTFLGGMLVLFIYITSIASNEMFKIKLNSTMMMLIMMIMLSIMIYNIDKTMFTEMIKNSETMNLKYSINYKEMSTSLMKLYNKPTIIITITMMIYLFIALLAVVKITNINQGPMRKMN
uniref:NADH-ubiquinone oxidoreductase chain 6 n=2 Tax=Acrididae TaxID=7002 RepID=A0A6G6A5R2_9ORTH|nr:NADH dehydrogenase subunit 6 [Oedaleus abruptus]YP_009740677.1 NADH dehydrogenase subunit 6 [Mecostethus alliaceus]QID03626.1 NADH dehydrogenase subunit 6 [Oedaleus abruptus]QID03639.1 NADH dehydrogenase subunit 6 [Mecostethus alliaceus]UPL65168.1 NADH dehydrogenase subunit 6 [Oedaleus abruptus]